MVGYIMEMENLCIFKLMAAGPAMELPTFLAEAGAGGCVGGRAGAELFILALLSSYCQVIDSIREIGATEPPGQLWSNAKYCATVQHHLNSATQSHEREPCARVLGTIVLRVSHEPHMSLT